MQTMRSRIITIAAVALVGCTMAISCGQPKSSGYVWTPLQERAIVSDETTVANTVYGAVQGYKDGDVYTFKGIQYAKAERFMQPQAPDSWDGVKVSRIYGPKCPQTGVTLDFKEKPGDSEFGFNGYIEPMDEDNCLVLNVWTKGLDDGKKRPVFFWIHGGGFATGSASELQCYEGRALAEKGDIVVVSINHRLNILGYLDLRSLGGKYSESVNLGMQDIVKALEWVNANIEQFGGDPGSVTIAGQSGGGGKVDCLMSMPSAMGLFHRGIAQSGSWILHNDNEAGMALGKTVLDELGVPSDPEAASKKLASLSYDELVAAGNVALRKANLQMFCPTVDGKWVTDPSFDPDAPTISKHIPMMIGSNQNEFAYNRFDISEDEIQRQLVEMVGEEDAPSYMADYLKAYPDGRRQDVLYTDLFLRKKAVAMADVKSGIGSAVYAYLFAWKPAGNNLGSVHGMEMPFMFNNIALQREMTGGTPDAYALADLVSSAWINFIKTGDPNTPGLPEWEPYTAENGSTMVFDKTCSIVHNHDRDLLNNHVATMHF